MVRTSATRPPAPTSSSTRRMAGGRSVLRQNLGRRQVVDLSALIRRESRRDDHPLAPPASTSPVPLRRPSPARPREPGLAPPARRVQEDEASAQASHDGSPLLARAGQGLGWVAAVPRDRNLSFAKTPSGTK